MSELTAERLRELLSYEPSSGVFRWISSPSPHIAPGSVAGCASPTGYIFICIGRVLFMAHRLAWLHTYGVWPSHEIDHIDCDKKNNAISNLREATRAQNNINRLVQRNNKSGYKGVHLPKGMSKWRAQIRVDGRIKHLGYFNDPADAHNAYAEAALRLHGEFARTE